MLNPHSGYQPIRDGDNSDDLHVVVVQPENYGIQADLEPDDTYYRQNSYQRQGNTQNIQNIYVQNVYNLPPQQAEHPHDADCKTQPQNCVQENNVPLIQLGDFNPNGTQVAWMIARYLFGLFFLVIGVVYINKCPADARIPAGVAAIGVLLITIRLLNIQSEWRSAFYSDDSWVEPRIVRYVQYALIIAIFAIMAYLMNWSGQVMAAQDSGKSDPSKYCDRDFYSTVLWITSIIFTLIGLAIIGYCCKCCKNEE